MALAVQQIRPGHGLSPFSGLEEPRGPSLPSRCTLHLRSIGKPQRQLTLDDDLVRSLDTATILTARIPQGLLAP